MQIIVINMPSATRRKERILSILNSMHLECVILRAIDGKIDAEKARKGFINQSTMLLSDGEFGCMLSHIKAWEIIANCEKQQPYLILEDDVYFASNFKNLLQKIKILPDSVGIFRLETMLARVEIARKIQQTVEQKYQFHQLYSNHAGAAAYILNNKTAKFLLQEAPKLTRAIDTELFDPNRRNISPFPVYQCIPSPCIQVTLLKDKTLSAELTSQISGREDSYLMPQKKAGKFVNILKILLRPFYLFCVSQILRRKGRARVHVPFDS